MKSLDHFRDLVYKNIPPLDLNMLQPKSALQSHQISKTEETTPHETGQSERRPIYFGKKSQMAQTSPGR
jgi:hypothetical protein